MTGPNPTPDQRVARKLTAADLEPDPSTAGYREMPGVGWRFILTLSAAVALSLLFIIVGAVQGWLR